MSTDESPRPRRERSARYPGVPLAEAVEFCRSIDERGLDGLPAETLASGLGYSNIRTNAFSARVSAARQFGLLEQRDEGHQLTSLARSILHPDDPAESPRLLRRALLEPTLYSSLAARLAGRRVPEPAILANVLYHHEQITASAKLPAAEAFLESARFAGALGEDGIFRPDGPEPSPDERPAIPPIPPPVPPRVRESPPVRIDLRLWGPDRGKVIRVRAPEAITSESFERLIQALRLHVRIDDRAEDGPAGGVETP